MDCTANRLQPGNPWPSRIATVIKYAKTATPNSADRSRGSRIFAYALELIVLSSIALIEYKISAVANDPRQSRKKRGSLRDPQLRIR